MTWILLEILWRKSVSICQSYERVYSGTVFFIHGVYATTGWWSGVVVSALASISEVNQRRARLVLRWMTVSWFNSRYAGHLFRYVTNQPPKANSAFHPSGVGK